MKIRAKITVTGRVQKAGYRDFVDEVAYNLQLNGYVKNLKNGTVEIVCEGEKESIEKLAKKINIQKYPIRVENVDIEYSKATGKFKEFTIVREENITKATYERMDVAARYMREMHTDLKGTIIKGDTELKDTIKEGNAELGNKVDKGFHTLGAKVDNLGNKIDDNFNRMDQKYDVISERMVTIMEELKQARVESAKATENLTKVVQTFVEIYKIH